MVEQKREKRRELCFSFQVFRVSDGANFPTVTSSFLYSPLLLHVFAHHIVVINNISLSRCVFLFFSPVQ